jgi:uncharacterized protein YcbK (DUF882 family)
VKNQGIANNVRDERMTCSPLASRRRALLGLAAPLLLSLTPDSADAKTRTRHHSSRRGAKAGPDVLPPERTLVLHHQQTGERLRATYYADGRYQPETLHAVDRLLRDWHQDRTRPTDPRLLDLVWLLRQRLESDAPVEVLCGYRTPETNALLRRTSEGVARNSLHMRAMAMDLRLPGRSLRAVQAAALGLRRGGVGYYPQHAFVHVDTGPVRHWAFGV